jgi:transposase
MPKRIKLRTLTEEEKREVERLAISRKAPARLVQRAKVIKAMLDKPELSASVAGRLAGYQRDLSGITWVKRFNEEGVEGLQDKPRPGRPRTHDEDVRSALIDLALQKPRTLGYPFELWTLIRLQTAFEEREGIHLSDSTVWEWLRDEGLDWKRQQSWFHDAERHDPEFVEKRGR